MNDIAGISRAASRAISGNCAILLNRAIALIAVSLAFAGYFWRPVHPVEYALDILLRFYFHFIAGSMAHEAVHGHLGTTRSQNVWWGRIAILPTTVPFVVFQKTHLRHHAATNIPGEDPDEFLNTRRFWQVPLRTLALPSYWLFWLWRRGRLTQRDCIEYAVTCLTATAIFAGIGHFVGTERVLFGWIPSAVLHALVLWYNFAIKTHEGYSTGAPETRSHNYYGRFMFYLSFGLSMHRLHHMQPRLAWLQMSGHVPSGTWRQCLRFERDVANPRRIHEPKISNQPSPTANLEHPCAFSLINNARGGIT